MNRITMAGSWHALFTFFSLGILSSYGCSILGQLFCDKCWDGDYDSKYDTYISGAKVSANCTVMMGSNQIYFWGSAYTTENGTFQAALSGTTNYLLQSSVDAAFMFALFKGSSYSSGLLRGSSVLGCQISLSNAGKCGTLSLDDGYFNSDGKPGNGWTSSNLGLVQYGSTHYADIYLGSEGSIYNSLAATPAAVDPSCPNAAPSTPGVKGDPHFSGADGSHFDFTGEPGSHYCLLSDDNLHVNAYYGGRYDKWGDNPHKALTWIRQIGILWDKHTVTLAAREGAQWEYGSGYMAKMEVDGQDIKLAQEGDIIRVADGDIEISWLAAKMKSGDDLVDVYSVRVGKAAVIRLTLRPEIALLRTASDGVVHFSIEFPDVEVSDMAHGVLGQTFRSDHRSRLSKQKLVYDELLHTEVVKGANGEGYLDGVVNDYKSSGLLKADCKFHRFHGTPSIGFGALRGLQITAGGSAGVVGRGSKILNV